jgi:hypothetical protein
MSIGSFAGMGGNAQLSAVTSSEWNTYMQHFVPYENMLIKYATDPNTITNAEDQASQIQTAANAQEQGIQQRNLAQTETTLTPEEKAQADKTRGIGDALSMVTAKNKAKDTTVANQMGIMGTPMTGITGSV